MNTFKQFLNEDEVLQDLEDFLLDNCRPLMSELDASLKDISGLQLYRGIGHPSGKAVQLMIDGKVRVGYIQTVRKNRQPLDTHPAVSDVLDDYFDHEFGWRPRKTTMFAYGKNGVDQASNFGRVYRVFPMGKFRYIWGEVEDLTQKLAHMFDHHGIKKKTPDDDYTKDELDEIYEVISDEFEGQFHSDDLWKAISGAPREIMIDCDQYLAISASRDGSERKSDD